MSYVDISELKNHLSKFKITLIPESIVRMKMSDEEYFSSTYSNYISNSKLNYLDLDYYTPGSYERYLIQSYNTSGSLSLGSAVHQSILENDKFDVESFDRPTGKGGEMVDLIFKLRRDGINSKDALYIASDKIDYYKDKLTDKRIKTLYDKGIAYYKKLYKDYLYPSDKTKVYLDPKTYEKWYMCINSIKSNDNSWNILYPSDSLSECEIFTEDVLLAECIVSFPKELSNTDELVDIRINLKIKIDNWNYNPIEDVYVLNDLKTSHNPLYMFSGSIEDSSGEFVKGSFQKYNYCNQIGYYFWIWSNYIKQNKNVSKSTKFRSNIVCVETSGNFGSEVFNINNTWLKNGYNNAMNLLKIAAYVEYNKEKILNDIRN